VSLVRAPAVIGSVIAGALVLWALLQAVTSNSRWDDSLLNAAGVFAGGLFVSLTLRLVTAVFRPKTGQSARARIVNLVWLVVFVLLVAVVVTLATFINDMSFL
jgi:hypothetical protein